MNPELRNCPYTGIPEYCAQHGCQLLSLLEGQAQRGESSSKLLGKGRGPYWKRKVWYRFAERIKNYSKTCSDSDNVLERTREITEEKKKKGELV